MRLMGQYNARLTLSPRLHVKPLTSVITAINSHYFVCADLLIQSEAVNLILLVTLLGPLLYNAMPYMYIMYI